MKAALVVASFVAASTIARAQCEPDWLPGPRVPGVNGFVIAQVKWDPDGSGPAPLLLVVAGLFTIADRELAYSVAAWDGASWTDLGFEDATWYVNAMTVYNGQLIVAAGFTKAPPGNPNLFRRIGSSWVPLGSGVSQYAHPYESNVSALAVYQGQLIAAGSFSHAGGQPASNIARWNGTTWQPLGTGVDGAVGALLVHNLTLHVGGWFASAGGQPAAHVATWNGAAWQPMGAGVAGSVSALTAYAGGIAAGGWAPDPGPVGSYANFVAHWNGSSWQALGGAMAPTPVVDTRVYALSVYNGELVAGGRFRDAPGAPESGVHRWNGSAWQPVGSGVVGDVYSLGMYQGALVAGGGFTVAGGKPASGIATWSSSTTTWYPLGGSCGAFFEWGIRELAVFDGEPVAIGRVVTSDGRTVSIVRRSGDDWLPLGDGEILDEQDHLYDGPVAAAPHANELVIGGWFASVGGVEAARIARWDGAIWRSLGSGVDNAVYALTDYGGDLIAGGFFLNAGGQPASRIARWDAGAQTWHPLGAGVGSSTGGTVLVKALTTYEGSLIAGGSFTTAGGQPANRIARWDGAAWSALGAGLTFEVGGLVEYAGDLVAITQPFPFEPDVIARWDGVAWQTLQPPVGLSFTRLAVYHDDLVLAGGPSTQSGTAPSITRWNGSAWQPLGAGLWSATLGPGSVGALLVHEGVLIAGGWFVGAGGEFSYNVAQWGCPCYADCNQDQVLGVGDFSCFQTQFVLGSSYADCNSDGTHTVADFGCFQSLFVLGCP